MRKPHIGLCPEGLPVIFLAAFTTLVFAMLEWPFFSLLLLAVTIFCVNFFRDPERVVPRDEGIVVAPADGKVVKSGREKDPFTGEERDVVCIFMNVFNVHVNRMPVTGTIQKIHYIEGKYINASFDKASEDNERNLIHFLDSEDNTWTMVQIAGLVARRIVCRAEVNDEIQRGERYGMIKFGSRVDLYLPGDYKPSVKIGDKTIAGQTILAKKS